MTIDLDAYFARIGYDGPRSATLETLAAIQAAHVDAIPFENLNPLLGLPVKLDLESLQAKLVGQQRGGYCFEQNGLFEAVLNALGFAVTPLIARVIWMAPPGRPVGPRSHKLLRVDLDDGPWLADVGFGGHLVAAPLRLEPDVEQMAPASVLRLVRDGEALVLETLLPSGWQGMYRFTAEPAYPSDYEVSNWYTSTHPTSIFTQALVVQRLTSQARLGLSNLQVTRRFADGRFEQQTLVGAEQLAATLEGEFGIQVPVSTEALFARLPKA
jgi:N-hydroxyarylamine O-acetyltransferase